MTDAQFETHEVFNQPPPLEDINLFTTDPILRSCTTREGAGWAEEDLTKFGALTGSAEVLDLGRQANAYTPVLKSFDRYGHRTDQVEFHPSYHRLMEISIRQGLHASPWDHLQNQSEPKAGGIVARLAGFYMMTHVEAGHTCPITMTNACIASLVIEPELAKSWVPRVLSRDYDSSFSSAEQKSGVTIGMGMTEKQGGTDVRANTTKAVPVNGGGPSQEYLLTGHKWFFSAPMCDAFLVLANSPNGLSCFLLPRFTPDGRPNAVRIQRLKEKVGNRSNASSEVEFEGASAWMIGEEGRGVANIIEMVTQTRLDCAVASAAHMRHAFVQATHHCRHRRVFQKHLIDQPLMTNVLADLALEAEAATALVFRLAGSYDRAHTDKNEAAYRRIMNPVTKYWVCKRLPSVAHEAMECVGGNGYVEDGPMGRIYREAPLNAIWEGSGNVMCLDLLRALGRDPESLESVFAELGNARGQNTLFDSSLETLKHAFTDFGTLEQRSRAVVELFAKITCAALLIQHAPDFVSNAYCASRLEGSQTGLFGTLPSSADCHAIVDRALPN